MKVFVLGAGTMGSGIAQTFAEAGYKVILFDLEESAVYRGFTKINSLLEKGVQKGKINEQYKKEVMLNISTTIDINDAASCDIIIEAILEDIDIKKNVFSKLDAICKPDAILCSNTSSLSITEIASVAKRPERIIGMHFFNPVPVMNLIEVIKGIATSDETSQSIINISKQIGKTAVVVNEAPGFVVNRILIPMINEAVGVLADGIAAAENIDHAMKLGANHPIGPLALADMIGIDVCLNIMEVLYNEYSDAKYRPHPLMKKMVRGGLLGRKSGKGFYEY